MAKILMIDDSAAIRQLAMLTLKSRGHYIDEASDGQQGLEKATRECYDIIITDRNMPVMNGIELLQALRQRSQYRFTPILILSTERDQKTIDEGKEAGATGWITKPFNPEALIKTVEKALL